MPELDGQTVLGSLFEKEIKDITCAHRSREDLPVITRDRLYPALFQKIDKGQIIVFIQAAPDFSAVFPVAAYEILDGAAVSDIALAAAAHAEFGARMPCLFKNQAIDALFYGAAAEQARSACSYYDTVIDHKIRLLSDNYADNQLFHNFTRFSTLLYL